MNRLNARLGGFSLIELVIVLVLLGITATVLISTLSSPSSFDVLAVRDGIISVSRSAQQYALGRDNVSFTIEEDGSEWLISAKVNGGSDGLRSISVPNSVVLETGASAATTQTCEEAFDTEVASDFSVGFDARGNAVTFTNNSLTESVQNGVRICIDDDSAMSVCISPGGFAHEGNCEI